ncbi:MAG: ABC transporter substrate-binding protein [Chloroflexota bacterium]
MSEISKETIEILASVYIPADWRQAIAQGQTLPEHTRGAALFADISGFSSLTEALVRAMGPRRGVEELPQHLNRVYDALITEIDHYAGSVIDFAGDSITCWFADEQVASSSSPPARFDCGARRATACGLSMQRVMQTLEAVPIPGQEPVFLGIKVAIASGEVRRFVVGNADIQLIPALAGSTLNRMAAAEHLAKRGEVLVDAPTIAQVEAAGLTLQVSEWRSDVEPSDEHRFAVLDTLKCDLHTVAEPAPWPQRSPAALREDQVRPWVLPAIYARLRAGLGDFLTELRPAVAVFVRFQGIHFDEDPKAGEKLNAYIRWVQQVITHYDGTLLQLTIGDKGSYLYATFGAPAGHEDDAQRALNAALEIRQARPELDFILPVQIGISRGTMRTGTYGGRTRRTYGVLGDQVILAARLMQYAQPGEVIVNQILKKSLGEAFTWDRPEEIRVKGKQASVAIVRLGERIEPGAPVESANQKAAAGPLVGRLAEFGRLKDALEKLQTGQSRVLIIQGQAGIGKSRLVRELLDLGNGDNLTILQGAGQSIEQHSPYRAWRDIFKAYFNLGNGKHRGNPGVQAAAQASTDPEKINLLRKTVRQYAPERLEHLPLLNDLLNLGIPDNNQTLTMDAAQRQQALLALLLALIQGRAKQNPVLLVFEDAQWLDSLSWTLIQRLAQRSTPDSRLLMLLVTRPLDDDASLREASSGLRSLPGTEIFNLPPLSGEEIVAITAARLDLPVAALPPVIASLVRQRAEGNPFYAEQLVLTLLEQGLIQVLSEAEPVRCEVCEDRAALEAALPDTIQGLILSRIDRLPLERQLVLKVAAVIGRSFAYNPLSHTLKQHAPISEAALNAHLGALDARELVWLEIPEPDLTYIFKHLTVQEIAYQTMAYAQRRQIHREVARWYESAYTADLSPVYALLAHHWSQAEDTSKAVHYLLLAGDEARRLYALPEAIQFYQRALAFLRASEQYEHSARTLMKLGLTYHLAFNYREARQAYEEGFTLWQQAAQARPEQAAYSPAQRPLRADCPYLPMTLDPGMADDIDTVSVIDQLFCGLVDLEAGLDIIPDVAQSWEILEEGRKYIFHLREQARWSDGQAVTASDFEYAWKRVLNPDSGSLVAQALYDIKGARAYSQRKNEDANSVGVQAVDEHTLVVELEQPTSYFLYLLAFSASYPIPRHVVEAHGEAWTQPEHLVTNGPFYLESWEQSSDQEGVLALKRNPNYHGRFSGNVQRVELVAHPEEGQRLSAYESGELDLLSFRNLTGDRDQVRQRHSGEYLSAPFLATTYLAFDATRPPFDDERLRQAFAQAIDKELHADIQLKGFAFPATGGFLPPGMPGHTPNSGLPFDSDEARRLLAESAMGRAGALQQNFPAIEFLAGPGQESITAFITAQWQEHLGLDVRAQILDWEAFMQCLDGDMPHIFLNIWVNDYPDPDNFLRASNAIHWIRWQNPDYQNLVEAARRTSDQNERLEMYRQADQILMKAAMVVPFNYWRTHLLIKPCVKKLPTSAIKWWYWKDVVLEQEDAK